MTRRLALAAATALVAIVSFAAGVGLPDAVRAHEDHGHFSAGEPGDPKKPARVVKVKMFEDGKKMLYEPALIEVRRGEQVRFLLENSGDEDHEFVLATIAENKKHGEMMKKFPDMEHDDPNARRVMTYGSGELVWKFTKRGEFEFACLIPGHYEAGMHGKIIVK
jgi:uncharacterized cupredoxin-like copper-binding protein